MFDSCLRFVLLKKPGYSHKMIQGQEKVKHTFTLKGTFSVILMILLHI